MFQLHFKSGNMNTKYFLILAFLPLLFSSCGKELTPAILPEKVAIVESYLHTGDSTITVKVTKLLPFSADTSDATEYIGGLNIQINGFPLTETDTGVYTLLLGDKRIQPGELYKLKFLYYGDTVSSTTVVPLKPVNLAISSSLIYTDRITSSSGFPSGQMSDIDLTWDNTDSSYYYVLIEYLETTRDYINYRSASQDLSTIQSISPMSTSSTRIGMRNLYFFGSYRIVLFKINKDFVDLYQQTTSNSNNITTPVTTINNGFGVFTGMASDTVNLEVVAN
jgi:hypothetical protein